MKNTFVIFIVLLLCTSFAWGHINIINFDAGETERVNNIYLDSLPNCSDVGFSLVSKEAKIENGQTVLDLKVSCKDASYLIFDEQIKIYDMKIFSPEQELLLNENINELCERATDTELKFTLDNVGDMSYLYYLSYGINFSGEDINCLSSGSFSVFSQRKEARVPDSNILVVLIVLLIVSIVITNKKENKMKI